MVKIVKNLPLDRFDRAILSLLQQNAALSLNEISKRVKLSSTPCWRRIQKLEDDKVILKRVTLLDPKKINLDATVLVAIRTNQHNEAWLKRFAQAVQAVPEITEVYRMSGDVDYMLKVVVPDISGYDKVYKKLISLVDLQDVSSSFAMEQLKYTTELPLDYTS